MWTFETIKKPIGLIILFVALSLQSFAWETGKDTTKAFVVYNEHAIELDSAANHSGYLHYYMDSIMSLSSVSSELMRELELCKSIYTKSEDELVGIIDSLFTLDNIPYALINEINFQIALKEDIPDLPLASEAFVIPDDGSGYPANYFYQKWNTKSTNPYSPDLSKYDSTLVLDLGAYHHPVDNIVTSRFGWRDGRNHNGIDLDLEVWDPVHSAWDGVVRFASWGGGFGRLVIVRHFNGLETYYAHLHRFKVEPGDYVHAGQVVGLGGSSGHSTGSHLHFEIRFKGIPLNPDHLIDFKEQQLLSDLIVLNKSRWSYSVFPKGTLFHHVRKGEFLQRIASRYGTTISELCHMNGIKRNDYLRVGQKLRVGKE